MPPLPLPDLHSGHDADSDHVIPTLPVDTAISAPEAPAPHIEVHDAIPQPSAGASHEVPEFGPPPYDAPRYQTSREQTPQEMLAERFAYVVSPLIKGFRAYAPAWREYFQRSERNWRQSDWYREVRALPRVLVAVVLIAIASTFAVAVATKAAAISPSVLATAQSTPAVSGGIVLQQSPVKATASAQAADVLMGVWTSSASPSTGGSVQVFVRLTKAAEAVATGVPVSITVTFPGASHSYGPVKTDSYGLATFTVSYAGAPRAEPVYVTGHATVSGQKIEQQTYFVPQ